MNSAILKLVPFLLIIIGLLVLFLKNSAILAGLLILLGIVMIIEILWPEKWDVDRQ